MFVFYHFSYILTGEEDLVDFWRSHLEGTRKCALHWKLKHSAGTSHMTTHLFTAHRSPLRTPWHISIEFPLAFLFCPHGLPETMLQNGRGQGTSDKEAVSRATSPASSAGIQGWHVHQTFLTIHFPLLLRAVLLGSCFK